MRRRVSNVATCKWCSAIVRWVITEDGYHLPIDPHPVVDGNLVRSIDNAGVTRVRRVRRGEYPPGTALFVAHSRTCASQQAARARERYRRARRAIPATLGEQQELPDIQT